MKKKKSRTLNNIGKRLRTGLRVREVQRLFFTVCFIVIQQTINRKKKNEIRVESYYYIIQIERFLCANRCNGTSSTEKSPIWRTHYRADKSILIVITIIVIVWTCIYNNDCVNYCYPRARLTRYFCSDRHHNIIFISRDAFVCIKYSSAKWQTLDNRFIKYIIKICNYMNV